MTTNHEARWTTRYRDAGDGYLFGTAPNRFLADHGTLLKAGQSALLVADGEGRNSVWLAAQGLDITAVEITAIAIDRAKRLALDKRVAVRVLLADMLQADWPPQELIAAFDWVVGIFIQFATPAERQRQFAAMKAATRPGGRILLQGYTPKQLEYRTGGPADIENLYTPELLRAAFSDWSIEELVDYEDEIEEGPGHKGRSALIGMVARKPAA